MSDEERARHANLWRGAYTKVPWSILDEPWAEDPRALARYVRALVEADRVRRKRRRYVPRIVWEAVLERFGRRCVYCGRSDLPLQREHRLAVTQGGKDNLENIVPACEPCNRRKGTDHPDRWPILERI